MDGAYDQVNADDPTLVRIAAWTQHPFSSSMSATSWLLFLGLIACGAFMWSHVLAHFDE